MSIMLIHMVFLPAAVVAPIIHIKVSILGDLIRLFVGFLKNRCQIKLVFCGPLVP